MNSQEYTHAPFTELRSHALPEVFISPAEGTQRDKRTHNKTSTAFTSGLLSTAAHATAYCALRGSAPPVSLPKPMSTVPLATATCAAAQHAQQHPMLCAAG